MTSTRFALALLLAVLSPAPLRADPPAFRWEQTIRTERKARTKQGIAPHGLALDAQGRLHAADFYEGFVDLFDAEGKYERSLGPFPGRARNCAVDAGGNVHVTCGEKIITLGPDGKEVRSWKVGGGDFNAVHVGRFSGNLYVHAEKRTAAYDAEGNARGLAFPRTELLWALSEDAKGRLVGVASRGGEGFAGKIYRFAAGDEKAEKFSFDKRDLESPEALDVDRAGNVYVCDTYNHRIVVIDPEMKMVARLGGFGKEDANFRWPQGIVVDPGGAFFYVGDSGNHAVKKWVREGAAPAETPPEEKPPGPPEEPVPAPPPAKPPPAPPADPPQISRPLGPARK